MNPLFRVLVAYAMQAMPELDTNGFATFVGTLLKASKEQAAEDWLSAEEPDWWEEFQAYQAEELGEEGIEAAADSYKDVLRNNSVEALIPMALHARSELQLERAPKPAYRLRSIHATFHMAWEDGLRAEYTCRPFGVDRLDMTVPMVTRLSQVFADQFGEALLSPGLDAFHDQTATPFDNSKCDELIQGMTDYISAMPADRREPYLQVVSRIKHQFDSSFSPDITSPAALEAVMKGTTKSTLEWGSGPHDGGFQQ